MPNRPPKEPGLGRHVAVKATAKKAAPRKRVPSPAKARAAADKLTGIIGRGWQVANQPDRSMLRVTALGYAVDIARTNASQRVFDSSTYPTRQVFPNSITVDSVLKDAEKLLGFLQG